MMYIHIPSLAESKRDLAEFIRGSVPERSTAKSKGARQSHIYILYEIF